MANDIGPRIGIDGEAAFRKKIIEINTSMKTLATEMQAVTSAFDKNDKSQENLTAQNEVLNKQIDTQKQKLAELKDGLQKATDKYGENDKVTQGWQQAVNKATADLNKMERQLKDNNNVLNDVDNATDDAENAIQDLGQAMDNAEGNASSFGDVLGGNLVADGLEKVTDAAMDAGKAIADLALESEQSSGMMQAQLGLSAAEAEHLAKMAKSIWSEGFGEDLQDVNTAITTIRQNLGEMSDDELTKVSESALTLKQVFGTEINESMRTVKTMMENFGLTAQESFDLLTVGYQNGLDYSGEFLNTLNEYSPQFQSMGYSADQAMQLLIQGSQNGAFNLDKVADAMKEFNIRIKDGSDTTREGLSQIGIDYDSILQQINNGSLSTGDAMQIVIDALKSQDDTIKQNASGVSLFGTQWEDLGADVVLAMGEVGSSVSESMSNVEGATERAGNAANDNLKSKFDTALRGIQESLEPLAQQALDFANSVMPQVQDALKWVADNGSIIAGAIAGIVTAAAGLKILSIVDGVTKAWQKYKVANEAATVAQWLMNAAMSANPIGIIIVAIAALVAGLVVLWNTNEDFRNAVIAIWENVKEVIGGVVDGIVNFFTATIPEAWNSLISIFQGIPEWWNGIWTQVGQFFSDIWNNIVNFFTVTIPEVIGNVITWFGELPYNIGLALGTLLGNIVRFGTDAWTWVTTKIPEIINGIVNFFAELPRKIWTWLTDTLSKIGAWGSQTIQKGKEVASNFVSSVVNFFSELPGKIWNWLSNTIQNVKNWTSNLINTAKTEIPRFVRNVVDQIGKLPGKVFDIGKNIVRGIWDGISGMGGWLWDKVTGFARGVVDGIKSALGIHSPSKVFADEVGEWLPPGIGAGFEGAMPSLIKDMEKQTDNMLLAVQKSISSTPLDVNYGLNQATAGLSRLSQAVFDATESPTSVTNKSSNFGDIVFNIYPTESQSSNDITDSIADRLGFLMNKKEKVWG